MTKQAWSINLTIKTPAGEYTPKSDNLTQEAKAAAAFAGLRKFFFKIDGVYYASPAELPTNSIAALVADASVEAVEVEPKVTGA